MRVALVIGATGSYHLPVLDPPMGAQVAAFPLSLLDCSISDHGFGSLVSVYPSHLTKNWCPSTDLICNLSSYIKVDILTQACFTAVYGPVPGPGRSTAILRKSNLGVCGVCRRPMKVGDGDGGKSNSTPTLFFLSL